jgi:hypothetical protein
MDNICRLRYKNYLSRRKYQASMNCLKTQVRQIQIFSPVGISLFVSILENENMVIRLILFVDYTFLIKTY